MGSNFSIVNKWVEYDHTKSNGRSVLPHATGYTKMLTQTQPRRLWHVRITITYAVTHVGIKPTDYPCETVLEFQPEERLFLKAELSRVINREFKECLDEMQSVVDEGYDVTIQSAIVRCTIKG